MTEFTYSPKWYPLWGAVSFVLVVLLLLATRIPFLANLLESPRRRSTAKPLKVPAILETTRASVQPFKDLIRKYTPIRREADAEEGSEHSNTSGKESASRRLGSTKQPPTTEMQTLPRETWIPRVSMYQPVSELFVVLPKGPSKGDRSQSATPRNTDLEQHVATGTPKASLSSKAKSDSSAFATYGRHSNDVSPKIYLFNLLFLY